ncbi:MAG: type 4a pilus biogenesis protein PilO [Candidatus Sumerlaeia bacterium]|nr:type 4a pilus biogenesis protein PilO [Candidatus Sumerlaeia bacterium]
MHFTEKQKQVLTVGLLLCGVLLIFTLYFQFMFFKEAVEEARKAQTAASAEITKLNGDIKRMQDFIRNDEELKRLQARVEVAKRRLPSDPQAIQFLEVLRDSLQKTNVSFTRIEKLATVNRRLYEEIPYRVRGAARYHEFGQFINLIECHPERFMRVSEFTLDNNDARPTIHPMNIRISTFMFGAG